MSTMHRAHEVNNRILSFQCTPINMLQLVKVLVYENDTIRRETFMLTEACPMRITSKWKVAVVECAQMEKRTAKMKLKKE